MRNIIETQVDIDDIQRNLDMYEQQYCNKIPCNQCPKAFQIVNGQATNCFHITLSVLKDKIETRQACQ